MAAKDLIPIWFLLQCLTYDPETGILRWKERPRSHFFDDRAHRIWNTRWAHMEAGRLNKDGVRHIAIRVNGEQRYISAHRAAWALTKGEYPEKEITHEDTDRSNNRFKNLKTAPHTEIQQRPTARGAYIDFRTGRYRAQITINGRQSYRGTYDTEAEAHQAYLEAKRRRQH